MRSAMWLLVAAAAGAEGKPTMSLQNKCTGAAATAKTATTIRVTASGAKGYSYTCDAAYDAKAETTDKECAGWLPQEVVDGKEDLAITIEALDASGKRAVCMQWQLDFGAASGDVWWPTDPISETDPVRSAREFFDAKFRPPRLARPQNVPGYNNNTGNPDCGNDGKCNSPAIRDTVAHAYLDSMTYVSHACVPKKVNDILYGSDPTYPDSCFPPGVSTPELLRVSHKALAVSGMIYSIDRKCKEAWNIGKSESCVSFPVLHCHTHCDMTWNLGPGGIASWGMQFLNHHIPSPGIMIAQQLKKDASDKAYGDVGCGGK